MNLIYRGISYQKQTVFKQKSQKFAAFVKYRDISYQIPSNIMLQQSLSVLKYRSVEHISRANHSKEGEQLNQICREAENAG